MTLLRYLVASIAIIAIIASPTNRSALTLTAQSAPPISPADPATLEIILPPYGLLQPKEVYFGGTTCLFGGDSGTGGLGACTKKIVTDPSYQFSKTKVITDDPNATITSDDRYVVTISGFPKLDGIAYVQPKNILSGINERIRSLTAASAYSPPPATTLCVIIPGLCSDSGSGSNVLPYGYQVTFEGATIPAVTINNYRSYLASRALTNAYLGNNSCEPDQTGATQLCLKTEVKLDVPEYHTAVPKTPLSVFTIESIALTGSGGTIQFEGNVAGGGTLSGFGYTNSKAIAVGGSVVGVQGNNTKLPSTYVQDSTKLSWGSIAPQLQVMFNKRTLGTSYDNTTGNYTNPTWNLNSTSNNPTNNAISSFSSPPEGKLWNVGTKNNLITFTAGTNNFNGRGTIVVNGDVTFNGDVSCPDGQFGLIASGTIIFNGHVNCGAFTSLNGDIIFNKTVIGNSEWTGIFVAKKNINLPTVASGSLIIRYNTDFANDPTILYKELLGIVFGTSS